MESTPSTPANWQTPAGRLLDRLAASLPPSPPQTIIVFGSAALQLLVDGGFLSQDVDVVADEGVIPYAEKLSEADARIDLVLQVCDPLTFRTAQGWEKRAQIEKRAGHTFLLPHPWDILVSKLGRLEPKDLEAFRLVIEKTGHPTAEELKERLQLAVDLYRPNFDEEAGADYTTQTQVLWQELFQRDIAVRDEIIRPALERRQRQYEVDAGNPAWKNRLREL